ncbi:hypothetical protein [uncultured Cohaesibacter sp.]|nr:hypothetical protein [uncultured Cohaesibacter sp.]
MLVWIGTKFGSSWLGNARKLDEAWKKDRLPTCENLRDLIRGLYF